MSAEIAREKYNKARRDYEKLVLRNKRIEIEAPRLWKELKETLRHYADEFNSEFTDLALENLPIIISVDDKDIKIKTGCNPVGQTPVQMTVTFMLYKESIECQTDDPKNRMAHIKPPDSIYFDMSRDGTVYFTQGDSVLCVQDAAKSLLLPFFRCAGLENLF